MPLVIPFRTIFDKVTDAGGVDTLFDSGAPVLVIRTGTIGGTKALVQLDLIDGDGSSGVDFLGRYHLQDYRKVAGDFAD